MSRVHVTSVVRQLLQGTGVIQCRVDVEGDNDDNSVVSRQPSEVEFVEVEEVVVVVIVVVVVVEQQQWVYWNDGWPKKS